MSLASVYFRFLSSFSRLCLPQQVSFPLGLFLEWSRVVTHEQRDIKVVVVLQPLQVLIGARA